MAAHTHRFFIIFCLWLGLTPCVATSTSFKGNAAAWLTENRPANDQAFSVDTIAFSADVPISRYEFFYLSDLKEHTTITKEDLERAYRRLMAKKRFSSIAFDLQEINGAISLHAKLTAQWVFKKIVFDDIWLGASSFQQLYLQQPGDPFEAQNHEESLRIIQEHLNDHGFFKSKIQDSLHFNEKNNTITVHMRLNKKERFTVNSVDVHFLNKANNDTYGILQPLLKKTRERLEGAPYAKKQITQTIQQCKKILRKNGYSEIGITHEIIPNEKKATVDVIISIKTAPSRSITITGNTVLSTEYILHDVIAKQIPDWLFSPDVLQQHLLHEYYKKGYWHARITYALLVDNQYVFTITEGNPLQISSVVISGNKQPLLKEAQHIIDQLAQTKGNQASMGLLLDQLKALYLAKGFWDFSIQKRDFIKNADGKTHTVSLHLFEGKQRLWGGFSIKNAKKLEHADFFKQFKRPTKGEKRPCNLAWITEQRQFILHHYQQRGYWYVDAQPEIASLQNTDQTETVFLLWKIDLGPLVRFGKTILQGSTSVPFHRIQKHIAFHDGDVWDRKKIDATRQRLRMLDVFKTTHVQPMQLSRKKSHKNIALTLVDDDPIELRARVGYYFNSGNALFRERNMAKLGASFILKNPSNRADKVTVDGDWNPYERKFNMVYQQPMPLNFDGIGKTQVYMNKLVHPAEIKRSGSAYQALVYGIRGSLENDYKQNYFWSLAAGNEWAKITKVQGNLKFDPGLINKVLPYFFVEPRLTINRLNDPIYTTEGYNTQASIRFIVPEHNNDLEAKLVLEQSFFFPLTNRLVLALRGCFGHLFRGKFEKILPNERFYLGGQSTVRGYGQDTIPPLGSSLSLDESGQPITHYTIQGGSSMLQGNIELRYSFDKTFGITLFHDIGILSQDGLIGLQGRWYPGSGVGLRYKTPIGSIRFDIGWRWKKRLKEDTNKPEVYITLNEAF